MNQKPGCAQTLARILAFLLAAFFIMILPLSLLAHDVGRVIYSPAIMSESILTNLIQEGDLREKAVDRFLSAIVSEAGGEGEPFLQDLSPAARAEAADLLMPEDWLQDQVNNLINDFYKWLNSEAATLELSLDLRPIRDAFLGGNAERFAVLIVDSLPQCTPKEVQEMVSSLGQGQDFEMVICRPPGELRDRLVGMVARGLREQARQVPTTLPLQEEIPSPEMMAEMETFRDLMGSLQLLLRWIWILPVITLGLIMILGVRSLRDLGLWWGLPLLLGGMIGVGLAFVLRVLGSPYIRRLFLQQKFPTILQGPALALLVDLQRAILARYTLHSGVIATIGFFLFILTLIIAAVRRSSTASASTSEPDEELPQTPPSPSEPSPPPVRTLREEDLPSEEVGEDSGEDKPAGMFG